MKALSPVVGLFLIFAAGCGSPARLFLHPVAATAGTPADFGAVYEDVAMPRPDGGTTRGWWLPVEGARAAVVLFGGNSGNRSHHLAYARMVREAGFPVLMVEYQGFGPDNGEADLGAFREDAAAALAFVGARADRIGLWGISLGSSVALLAAGDAPGRVDAVCVEGSFRLAPAMRHYMAHVMPAAVASPLADLTRLVFLPRSVDPERNLRRLRRDLPVLFVHGDRDALTRTVWGAELFELAPGRRSLWLMEDTGHAPEPLRSSEGEYAAQVTDFFRRTLLGASQPEAGATWRATRVPEGWEVRADVVADGPWPAPVEVVAVADTEVRRLRFLARGRTSSVTLTLAERPHSVSARRSDRAVVAGASWSPRLSPIARQHRALLVPLRELLAGRLPDDSLIPDTTDPVLAPAHVQILLAAALLAQELGQPERSRALWIRAVAAAPEHSRHFVLHDAQYFAPDGFVREQILGTARRRWAAAGWDPEPLETKLRALPNPVPGE